MGDNHIQIIFDKNNKKMGKKKKIYYIYIHILIK